MSSGATSSGGARAEEPDWRATASIENLRRRAELSARLRGFFRQRGVLEVETPLLGRAPAVEESIDPIAVAVPGDASRYLMTSPELYMKRLVAGGSGPIYQIARAFRADERGAQHNPEFTLVEWYRPGFTLSELMLEVESLVDAALVSGADRDASAVELARPFARVSYAELFSRTLGVDPLSATELELRDAAVRRGVPIPASLDSAVAPGVDAWLNLLLAGAVEPALALRGPTFVFDYPVSQAALARVSPDDPRVAERFELYAGGFELANGYRELTDPAEQRARFVAANATRRARGAPELPLSEAFFAALESGLPEVSGVALGFDRLVMLTLGVSEIEAVLAFPDRIA